MMVDDQLRVPVYHSGDGLGSVQEVVQMFTHLFQFLTSNQNKGNVDKVTDWKGFITYSTVRSMRLLDPSQSNSHCKNENLPLWCSNLHTMTLERNLVNFLLDWMHLLDL